MNVLNTRIGDYWAAEYSSEQDAFNVETLHRAIEINGNAIEGTSVNYLIFGIFSTIEEAEDACDKVRKKKETLLCQNHRN